MLSHTRGHGAGTVRRLAGAGRVASAAALCAAAFLSMPAQAQELVIGEERIPPGIVFI